MNEDKLFIERSGKRYYLHETDRYSCKKCAFMGKHKDCPRLKDGELICCDFYHTNMFWREVEEVEK